MTKKNIITIAGKLGSGKSTTAKKIAETLGYNHYSTGDFMRQIALERGISLIDLSKIAEKDISIDQELDSKNKEMGNKEKIVLDSRLGFYFIPGSFKVFLELDSDTASERILKDKESNLNRLNEANKNFETKEGVIENINNRLLSEKQRYNNLYNIKDHTSPDNFDLVIDTSNIPVEEVCRKIIKKYTLWLEE